MQSPTKSASQAMHPIVWAMVSVLTLFAVTFPTAMLRVSQTERGAHVKSLPLESQPSPGSP